MKSKGEKNIERGEGNFNKQIDLTFASPGERVNKCLTRWVILLGTLNRDNFSNTIS